ncbi:MAG: hypothetical protein WBA73_16635 [Devosia sp.]
MRDLFRLLAVAAMSLAIVGVAMIYSRGGDLVSVTQTVTDGVTGVVADVSQRIAGSEPVEETEPGYGLSLTRPGAARWAGLAGFPDQAEVSFPMPGGVHYLSGALNLHFDTHLAAHGDGLMTLSVNGSPRGQIVLDSGRSSHQVRIDLTPADLASNRVVLQMSGRGTTGAGQTCPGDAANSGSAVTLTPDSRLELSADQPPGDAIQALAAAPRPFVLIADGTPEGMAFAIWANQQFNRAGLSARLGEAGAGETPIRLSMLAGIADALGAVLVGQAAVDQVIAAAGEILPAPRAWPVSVGDLGAETTVKTFRGSRRWTIPFNAADLPGGALPEKFRLRMATTPLAKGNDWIIRIALNGNLIEARRLDGSTDAVALTFALPAERLLPRNALVLELVDTTPFESICGRADAQAQLLPESMMSDSAPASLAWASLIENLAAVPEVSFHARESLSPAQASRAGDLLATLLPRSMRLSPQADSPVVLSVTDRANLGRRLADIAPDTGIKAILPARGGGALTVAPVPSAEFGAALEWLGPNDVIILATGL